MSIVYEFNHTENMQAVLSTFDTLQNAANEKMGCGVGVFNSSEDVQKLRQVAADYIDTLNIAIDAMLTYRATQRKGRLQRENYDHVRQEISESRKKEAESLKAVVTADNMEPLHSFRQEYEDIHTIMKHVAQKENELAVALPPSHRIQHISLNCAE